MNLAVENNINLNEKPCVAFESTKKRKLEHENVTFPLSKLKFKERSCGPDDESSDPDNAGQYSADCRMESSRECLTDSELDTSAWSLKDSNIINDDCRSTVTVDVDKSETSSRESWNPDWYSTSSSSCNNYAKENTFSLDRSGSTPVIQEEELLESDEVENEVRSKHQVCSGVKDDFLEFERIAEMEEESLLLSNAILADTLLSSGIDGVSHAADDKQGRRKPTIDQEFEQYFSMLML